jgi:UDP-N-acetylglucosamine 3-dehydrogenase
MRIAVLGAAHPHTREYLRALAALSAVEVVGLFDESDERGRSLAAEFALPHVTNVEELLAKGLDAVIVGDTVDRRPALIERALPVVGSLLCALPLAPSLAGVNETMRLCQARGATLTPALSLRLLPVFQSLKQILEKNELGEIVSARLEYQIRKPTDASRDLMLENIAQAVDLLCWLLGGDIAELYAETGRGLLHSDKQLGDAALLSVVLSNRVYAMLDVSLALPPGYPAPEDLKLEVIGTAGTARVDAYRQKIDTYTDTESISASWGSSRFAELLGGFINGGASLATTHDAVRAQEAAFSVYEEHHDDRKER